MSKTVQDGYVLRTVQPDRWPCLFVVAEHEEKGPYFIASRWQILRSFRQPLVGPWARGKAWRNTLEIALATLEALGMMDTSQPGARRVSTGVVQEVAKEAVNLAKHFAHWAVDPRGMQFLRELLDRLEGDYAVPGPHGVAVRKTAHPIPGFARG